VSTFAIDVARWCDGVKADVNTLVRAVAIEALRRVVMRTPVGNPELWAANRAAIYARQTHNLFAQRINEDMRRNPAAYGLKRAKPVRVLSARSLARLYRLRAGKGYVGGRARGSWVVSVGQPGIRDSIDAGGLNTIGAGIDALVGFEAGPPIYITNSVPYINRLEYEGWSKQAPAGMVRVTVAELQAFIENEVRKLAAQGS
jgi:hypothetical protein